MRGRELGGEEQEGFVRGSCVADQEVGENGAGGVVGRGRGLVAAVPFVLEVREDLGGIRGSEGEVSLGVVDFAFFGEEGADDMVKLWVAGWVLAEFAGPSGEACQSLCSRCVVLCRVLCLTL